jgi:hypothetical protein
MNGNANENGIDGASHGVGGYAVTGAAFFVFVVFRYG